MYISIHTREMEGGSAGPGKAVWLRKGGDAPLVIGGGGVDPGTYGKGEHLFRRERNEEGRQRARILERRVEPPVVLPRGKDHRHPVVDRGQDGVRSGRQDSARFDDILARAFPPVPQPGEGEESPVTHSDKVRLFPALPPLPLVETVRRGSGSDAA